jgi:hypothetical protein
MPVVILSLAGPICYRRASQSFPRDLSGFFARLLEVSVISPQVRSVFAAVYEDAAGPCRSDSYEYMSEGVARMLRDVERQRTSGVRVVLELRLGYLLRGAVVCGV